MSEVKKLDDKWDHSLEQIGILEEYEYLDGDRNYRENQKALFLSGEITNPNLDYPKIKLEELQDRSFHLHALKEAIKSEENNQTVREIYLKKINDQLASVYFLMSVKLAEQLDKNQDKFSPEEHDKMKKAFVRKIHHFLHFKYSKPNIPYFDLTLEEALTTIRTKVKDDSPDEIKQSAAELQGVLTRSEKRLDAIKLPNQSLVENLQKEIHDKISTLTQLEEGKDEYEASEIINAFNLALEKLGIIDWKVEMVTDKTAISVDQENKVVKVPATRKVKRNKLISLIAHEIGVHVTRRSNGEKSDLAILGRGLDRYERIEEGIATMVEQLLKGKVEEFAGFDGYLSIALAQGLDGKPRNFREVYDILYKYYLIEEQAKKNNTEAKTKAQDKAWTRAVRTFRGVPPGVKGICYSKDLTYREGNIRAWENIEDFLKTNPLNAIFAGKFDFTNPKHLEQLKKLGIDLAHGTSE
jgi:hypothetical protein